VKSHRASLRVLSGFAFVGLEADAGSAGALAEFDQSFCGGLRQERGAFGIPIHCGLGKKKSCSQNRRRHKRLSDRSFLSLDEVRTQPREAPFDLTMKVGVE
jgi:hypothetical protein